LKTPEITDKIPLKDEVDQDNLKSTSSVNSIVLDANTMVTKVPLLRKSIHFALTDGSQKCKLRALFDGGASICFVRLACLPAQLQKIIRDFKSGANTANEFLLIISK
jgi:hypothetical protein